MKKFLKIVGVIIAAFILVLAGGWFYITRGLDAGSKLEIGEIKLDNVSDGTYTGRYEAGRWTNELNVDVKDHKITGIKVLKDVKFVAPGVSDRVFAEVIEQQSTDVDTVSSATVTTKAYLKSIENAVNK